MYDLPCLVNTLLYQAQRSISLTSIEIHSFMFLWYVSYLHHKQQALFSSRFEALESGPGLPSLYDIAWYKDVPVKRYLIGPTGSAEYIKDPIYQHFYPVWEKYGWRTKEMSTIICNKSIAWYNARQKDYVFLRDGDIAQDYYLLF